MSALYEKMNNIRKRINKANAIVRNLNAAKEDYSKGHCSSCLDAVLKIKTLDPEHPEVNTLEKHAERRKKGEVLDDDECEETHSERLAHIGPWANKQEKQSSSSFENSEQMNSRPAILKTETRKSVERRTPFRNLDQKRDCHGDLNKIPQITVPEVSPARVPNHRPVIRMNSHRPLRTSMKMIIAGVTMLVVAALIYYIVSSFVSPAYIISALKITAKAFVCIVIGFIVYAIICIA